MGNSVTNLMDSLSRKASNHKILMLGMPAVGKTTILYQLNSEDPNTEFLSDVQLKNIVYKNLTFTIFDIFYFNSQRRIWQTVRKNQNALIYVFDVNDDVRFYEAKEIFHSLLKETELKEIPVLIFLNKIDGYLGNVDELIQRIDLEALKGRKWMIQPTNALKNKGIMEGLEWLIKTLQNLD